MPSRLINHDTAEFASLTMSERLTRCVIGLVKEGAFAGRVDMGLDDFDILERVMLCRHHPAFKLMGNATEGSWHISWVIAGVPVAVYPDRTLEPYMWRVEVRS